MHRKAHLHCQLVALRKQSGLTQREVAEALGTSQSNVSRWERGLTRPSAYSIHRLSRLFAVSEEEVRMALKDPPPPQQVIIRGQRLSLKRSLIRSSLLSLFAFIEGEEQNE